jgi:cellulose synthase/poly-beta-1,6-N-acetylglucosamine synthase-like glycosyltransferase
VISVITPTLPEREDLLRECIASVSAAGFPHLIAADPQHLGPAVVRNRLLDRVTTPWVVFLDDDDLLYPQYQRIVEKHFKDADVIYTAWDLTGGEEPKPRPFDAEILRHGNYIPVTACVRTEAIRAVGGFPEDWVLEDHGLWIRLLDAGYRFKYVPVIGWVYRRFPGSRTDAG